MLAEAAGDLGTFVDVVSTVGEPRTMWAQLIVFQAARAWARGAWRAPAEYIGKLNSTTATCRLGDHLGRRIAAFPWLENCIAKSRLAVSTGTSIAAQGETGGTLTVETARRVGAVSTHAGVALALVDVHTFSSSCLITRIT